MDGPPEWYSEIFPTTSASPANGWVVRYKRISYITEKKHYFQILIAAQTILFIMLGRIPELWVKFWREKKRIADGKFFKFSRQN